MSNFTYTRVRPADLLEVLNDQTDIKLSVAIAAMQTAASLTHTCPKCQVNGNATGWITYQNQQFMCDICVGNLKTNQLFIANPAIQGAYIAFIIGGTPTAKTAGTSQLTASVPGGQWSSDNQNVATVAQNTGLVTAIAVGTANITYTLNGATVTAQFTVTAQ